MAGDPAVSSPSQPGAKPASAAAAAAAGRPVPAEGGPLETAILFVDLVSSSQFSSVMSLRQFADYTDSFESVCREQCRHFFQVVHAGKYRTGRDYEVQHVGDELAVFLHTDKPANDVYQLVCLALTLKCGWLSVPHNVARVADGMATSELACGIHTGDIWATPDPATGGYRKRGYAINVAKRMETESRTGGRFRLFLSDPAFKRVNRRVRNLIFGPRSLVDLKGIVTPMGVHEVTESFVNPYKRLAPGLAEGFQRVSRQALASNSFDLWIHSCVQVGDEARTDSVSDENLALCNYILNIDPRNAVALFYAGRALAQRGDLLAARLYLQDLTCAWPHLADGWLELGRLLKQAGDAAGARAAILQARRFGVRPEEEPLP